MSRSIALPATRVAVMNSPLTVIDPAAPRRRNPIATGAHGDELRYGRWVDHEDCARSRVASVLVALGEAGCRCRHASHPHNGDRNNGERRMGHDIARSKVNMFEVTPRNFRISLHKNSISTSSVPPLINKSIFWSRPRPSNRLSYKYGRTTTSEAQRSYG